jgi:hypothetical protein
VLVEVKEQNIGSGAVGQRQYFSTQDRGFKVTPLGDSAMRAWTAREKAGTGKPYYRGQQRAKYDIIHDTVDVLYDYAVKMHFVTRLSVNKERWVNTVHTVRTVGVSFL